MSRFYKTFPEALNEIKRELKEMGIKVQTKSVQNIDISNNPDYEAFELQNYQYTVTSPIPDQIPLKNPDWATTEFAERICGKPLNPGTAWTHRKEYWQQFIGPHGTFDYAYPDRMAEPLKNAIKALQKDIYTRRAFIPVFDREKDLTDAFSARIPCTLGYWLYYRQNELNITYLQRSSDFFEHFNYDIYLADRLKRYVAMRLDVTPGTFSHWLGSLHCFAKDVAEVF